ncbi:MAG: hypothetical protein R2744_08510 [Bacteroidales bacterium]
MSRSYQADVKEGNNLVAVKWTIHKMVSFLARIQVNGIDRIGIVSDLT